jgi:hypothetical protein
MSMQTGGPAGRPKGSKTLRPRASPDTPNPWRNGRLFVEVTEEHIARALERDSSHCIIAMAIADALPHARHISVDLQSCRWTDPVKRLRYTALSPHLVRDIVILFDLGSATSSSRCDSR